MLAEQLAGRPTREEAFAYCRRLALGHYENFSVVSWLLPGQLRSHMYAVYAYCRGVDDLGDEAEGDRLVLLDEWEQELWRCYEGTATDIRFIALEETVQRFDIPPRPFLRLIEANRRDQRIKRYLTFAELQDYCAYSANPVGEIVLNLFGYRDEERRSLSDATCTALQLTNFWQDVSRDLEKGRIYVPREDMERFGYREEDLLSRRFNDCFGDLMRFEVGRTRELFSRGLRLLPLVQRRLRLDLRLFSLGGLAVLDAIERLDYAVLTRRPKLSRFDKLRVALRALIPLAVRQRRSG